MDEEEEENGILVRQALTSIKVIGDKSGEENDPGDVIRIITNCSARGATARVV